MSLQLAGSPELADKRLFIGAKLLITPRPSLIARGPEGFFMPEEEKNNE